MKNLSDKKIKKMSIIYDKMSKATEKYHFDVLITLYPWQTFIYGRGENREKALEDFIRRLINCLK